VPNDDNAAPEGSPSQHSDFTTLFESRIVGIVELLGEIWFMHLEIQSLQASHARSELRLRTGKWIR